jgi:hypothetical protein
VRQALHKPNRGKRQLRHHNTMPRVIHGGHECYDEQPNDKSRPHLGRAELLVEGTEITFFSRYLLILSFLSADHYALIFEFVDFLALELDVLLQFLVVVATVDYYPA